MSLIAPDLFAEHDDETLAGMHGLDLADVAAQRAALSGSTPPTPEAPAAPVDAPPTEAAAEPGEKPKRGQKAKPATGTPAAAPAKGSGVFRIEVPYDHTISRDVFHARVETAMRDALSALLGESRPVERPARAPGSAVKFIGPKSIRVKFPGSRSATEVNYGDIIVGAEADHMAENHPEHVEPHPRPRR